MSKLETNLQSAPVSGVNSQPIQAELAETRNGTSTQAKKIIAAAAAVLGTLGAVNNAEAQQSQVPCYFSLQGTDQTNVTVKPKETVRVSFVTGAQGQMKLPVATGEWVNDGFTPGACVGFPNPKTCGRHSAHMVAPDLAGVYSAPISVEGAQCSPASRVITVTVEEPPKEAAPKDPNEASWTKDEKQEVQDHMKNAPDGRWFDLGVGMAWHPNMEGTSTRVGMGLETQFNARPGTKHATIGGALRWMTTGQPIWDELRPSTQETTRNSYTAMLRAAGVITAPTGDGWDWLQLSLGGEFGATAHHHGQEDIGNNRQISSDTSFTPVVGPWVKLGLAPHQNFMFYGSADLPIELRPLPTNAGTVGQDTAPNDKIHATPVFNVGVEATF